MSWVGANVAIYIAKPCAICRCGYLNIKPGAMGQDQDSLLVKRRNENHSPSWVGATVAVYISKPGVMDRCHWGCLHF